MGIKKIVFQVTTDKFKGKLNLWDLIIECNSGNVYQGLFHLKMKTYFSIAKKTKKSFPLKTLHGFKNCSFMQSHCNLCSIYCINSRGC